MKPSDLMIGLINFLSILLPGVIATALLVPLIPEEARATFERLHLKDEFSWVVIFASAYFSGHLIFLAGSRLDPLYDYILKWRDPTDGVAPSPKTRSDRMALAVLCKRDWKLRRKPHKPHKSPLSVVKKIRRSVMTANEFKSMNTFQWCRAILVQHCPEAFRDIEVHEADQKFFRSLVVLALIVAVGAAVMPDLPLVAAALAIAAASFMRFYSQRLKTVNLAYIHLMILYRCGGLDFRPKSDEPAAP